MKTTAVIATTPSEAVSDILDGTQQGADWAVSVMFGILALFAVGALLNVIIRYVRG